MIDDIVKYMKSTTLALAGFTFDGRGPWLPLHGAALAIYSAAKRKATKGA